MTREYLNDIINDHNIGCRVLEYPLLIIFQNLLRECYSCILNLINDGLHYKIDTHCKFV